MRRSAHSEGSKRGLAVKLAAVVAVLVPLGMGQQLTRENGNWVRTIRGTFPANARLRVNAHGPVTLDGGTANELSYTVKLSVNARSVRSEAEARRWLQQYAVRVESQGPWTVLTAPGGAAIASMTLRTPRLASAVISTSEGAVRANGVGGALQVDTRAGELAADRIDGDSRLVTGGGEVRVGEIRGSLHCSTGAGDITVKSVRGEAVLETGGGDIFAGSAGGPVRAETGGGSVHIGAAGGPVTATSGGGEIVVDKANGIVTVRNMAGNVQVGSAAGVRCESGGGGIHVSNISGPMRVSTSMGSILATLLAGRFSDSYLSTGNGDITIVIPSNVGVNIQAQLSVADVRRIISDFREIQVRRQGPLVIAQGAVNGGGPLVQILGTGGTISIKRQR
jgi:DUF4097 and DUF4098 domain-containing protein YvlB